MFVQKKKKERNLTENQKKIKKNGKYCEIFLNTCSGQLNCLSDVNAI